MGTKATAKLLKALDTEQRSALFTVQNMYVAGNRAQIVDVVSPMFLLAAWDQLYRDHYAQSDFGRAVMYAIAQFREHGVVENSPTEGCGYRLTALGETREWA